MYRRWTGDTELIDEETNKDWIRFRAAVARELCRRGKEANAAAASVVNNQPYLWKCFMDGVDMTNVFGFAGE